MLGAVSPRGRHAFGRVAGAAPRVWTLDARAPLRLRPISMTGQGPPPTTTPTLHRSQTSKIDRRRAGTIPRSRVVEATVERRHRYRRRTPQQTVDWTDEEPSLQRV